MPVPPSIEQIARLSGVSTATVSRVFNAPDKVRADTRARVQATAKRLRWSPNAAARTLRTQKTGVLGVLLPTLLNPVFAECLDGIAQACAASGLALAPFTTDYDSAREMQAVQRMVAGTVDGALLVVADPEHSPALDTLRAHALPYVLLYNRHPAQACVSVDNAAAVAELVGWLGAQGHRRIAMLSGPHGASDRARQRCAGYLQGMATLGAEALAEVIEVGFDDAGVPPLARRLRQHQRPTALVCSNDLLALRAMRAARDASLSVPRDLSVAGFDGIALGAEISPRLCSVAQPSGDMGRAAVDVLCAAMARGQAPQAAHSLTLPHRLLAGESCAPPPGAAAPSSPHCSKELP